MCYVAVVSRNSVFAYQRRSHFYRRGQVQGPRVQLALCIPTIQRSTVKGSTLLGGTHVGNDSSDEKASFRLGHILTEYIQSPAISRLKHISVRPASSSIERLLISFCLPLSFSHSHGFPLAHARNCGRRINFSCTLRLHEPRLLVPAYASLLILVIKGD